MDAYSLFGLKRRSFLFVIDKRWLGIKSHKKRFDKFCQAFFRCSCIVYDVSSVWLLENNFEKRDTILNLIKEDLSISNASIARKMNRNQNSIGKIIRRLRILRYIDKEDKSNKFSNWVLLRSPSDTTTKLVYTNRTFEIIIGNERIEENMQALRTLLFYN